MLILFGIAVGVMLFVSTSPVRAENEAEAAICRGMAGEVLDGEASRFDYMATRCPAGLLIPAEGA